MNEMNEKGRARRLFLKGVGGVIAVCPLRAVSAAVGTVVGTILAGCQGGHEVKIPTHDQPGTVLGLTRQSGLILWEDERAYTDRESGRKRRGQYVRQVEYLKNPVFWLRRRSDGHNVTFHGDSRDASQMQVLPGHDIIWAEI